jgi:glycosyltransferase involved in cell wall biosynthesis
MSLRLVRFKLSIALTTFNGARFLSTQLTSYAQQTRLPDELVVCDDHSDDTTMSILREFAREAPFAVNLIENQKNLGLERNFSQAIELCDGDIIFLSDQDDWWHPTKLERIAEVFASNPGVMVTVNDAQIADAALAQSKFTVLGQIRAAGVADPRLRNLRLGCATAIRSPLRELLLPIPADGYGHDSWIHDFADVLDCRHVVRDQLQSYRRHEENVSLWHGNGLEPMTRMREWQSSSNVDLTHSYRLRAAMLRVMHERVERREEREFAGLGLQRPRGNVLRAIESAIAAVERRCDLLSGRFLRRKQLAVNMLMRGDYQHFLGLRSFAKDLLR